MKTCDKGVLLEKWQGFSLVTTGSKVFLYHKNYFLFQIFPISYAIFFSKKTKIECFPKGKEQTNKIKQNRKVIQIGFLELNNSYKSLQNFSRKVNITFGDKKGKRPDSSVSQALQDLMVLGC